MAVMPFLKAASPVALSRRDEQKPVVCLAATLASRAG